MYFRTNQKLSDNSSFDEPNYINVVRSRSSSKKVISCLFGCTGYVEVIPLKDRKVVNAEWQTTICLQKNLMAMPAPTQPGKLVMCDTVMNHPFVMTHNSVSRLLILLILTTDT